MNQGSSGDRGRVVAIRSFQGESGSVIVATLYEPVMAQVDKWKCSFKIAGLPQDIDGHAYGLDGMQALMMGLEGLRVHLEQAGETLTWVGGEPGELGIPRPIPIGYGLEFQRHIVKVIDDEVTRLVDADAKAKGRR